jgi:hypothetical protein
MGVALASAGGMVARVAGTGEDFLDDEMKGGLLVVDGDDDAKAASGDGGGLHGILGKKGCRQKTKNHMVSVNHATAHGCAEWGGTDWAIGKRGECARIPRAWVKDRDWVVLFKKK